MSDNDNPGRKKLSPPIIVLIILGLAFVGLLARGNEPTERASGATASASQVQIDAAEDAGFVAVEPAQPTTDSRIDRTLLPQERAQWRADPNSYGWNEGDRQFFEEHGVSEAEARAMETVVREAGVD